MFEKLFFEIVSIEKVTRHDYDVVFFVGPRKTATSALWEALLPSSSKQMNKLKEYPFVFFNPISYLYLAISLIAGKTIFVWPYLIHSKYALFFVVQFLRLCNRRTAFIVTSRNFLNWKTSQINYEEKHGLRLDSNSREAFFKKDTSIIEQNMKRLKAWSCHLYQCDLFDVADRKNLVNFIELNNECIINHEKFEGTFDQKANKNSHISRFGIFSRPIILTFWYFKSVFPFQWGAISTNTILVRFFYKMRG